jgi:hypothetical protein
VNGMENIGGVAIRIHFYGAMSMVAPSFLWEPSLWSHVYGLHLSYAHPWKAPMTMEIGHVLV